MVIYSLLNDSYCNQLSWFDKLILYNHKENQHIGHAINHLNNYNFIRIMRDLIEELTLMVMKVNK